MNPETLGKGINSGRGVLLERARQGNLLAMTMLTMPTFEANWHHKVYYKFLSKFLRRETRRIMVFMPPRNGKTEGLSRRLPAAIHGIYPHDEIMAATYSSSLAEDATIDIQRIMDHPNYREIWPYSQLTPEGQLSKYARTKNHHELRPVKTESGLMFHPLGSYRSSGVGGALGGRGADWLLLDDLVKNRVDADSASFRDKVMKFYTGTLRNRLEGEGSIALSMTRWHVDDPAGRLLKQAKADALSDQWDVICFPAIYDGVPMYGNQDYDPRQIGEPLWASKFPITELLKHKALGSRDWASLFQQRPFEEGGNIIKESDLRFYDVLPDSFDEVIQSWDFATKDKESSSYTVGQVWGRKGADRYLIKQVRGRWSFPKACQELINLSMDYPQAGRKWIEAKANGPAVMQTLKQQVTGLKESEPHGDKVARLNAVAPQFESHNVYFPKDNNEPWVRELIDELLPFPQSEHKDQVDTLSQALFILSKQRQSFAPISGHGME